MAACQLAKQKLSELGTIALPHLTSANFNEFVVELPGSAADCLAYLDTQGLIGDSTYQLGILRGRIGSSFIQRPNQSNRN